MARVRFKAQLACDATTGLPRLELAGQTGTIVLAGTTTLTPITDNDGLPITGGLITISASGFTPTFYVEDGLTEVDWWADPIRVPIDSTSGLEESAAASAAAAIAAAAAAGGDVSAAVEAYLVAHPPEVAATVDWDNVTNKDDTYTPSSHTHPTAQISDATPVGKSLMTAADAQAARTAIGAGTGNGTSNLALGTTSTTAAAGNHSHLASAIPFTPVSGVTALNVQDAIAQAAASGGSGSGDTVSVIYSSGAYPAQAASPPAGIKVRHFYGPVQYTGSTWSGVLDLYTVVSTLS